MSCQCQASTSHVNKNLELADIFQQYIPYLRSIGLNPVQWKVVNAIVNCRTSKLGGHKQECPECGYNEISYNSCRNRHCPKCQTLTKIRWLNDRLVELLPVPYFHVVFTVPRGLAMLILYNKEQLYRLFFRAVKETLLEAAQHPRNLGADIGFYSIMHSWDQQLHFHPHIHCVVPGGGITQGNKWKSCRKKFFIHVDKLSLLFRGKLLDYLKQDYNNDRIVFDQRSLHLTNNDNFKSFINELYSIKWVVYAKKPFAGPEKVFKYLSSYTHKIAISNSRLVSSENDHVTFKWKDRKADNKEKLSTINAKQFIKRFLLHVVPKGFVRIRNYGYLSNRSKKVRMTLVRKLLKAKKITKPEKQSWDVLLCELTGVDPLRCPNCNKERMVIIKTLLPEKYKPN